MRARPRRVPWGLILVAGILVWGIAVLLRETDEDRVMGRVTQFVVAVRMEPGEPSAQRRERILRAFEEIVSPQVVVRIPDLPQVGSGRSELAAAAGRLDERFSEVEVVLEHPSVSIEASGHTAKVEFRAAISGRSPEGALLTDSREGLIRLQKDAGGWRIGAIESAGPNRSEPEARP